MTACKKRRGFSLIEAAIVLGVVGLVIGGIWYAATSVLQNQRINNTADGILQIASGARRLFSYSDYPTVSGTSVFATQTAAAAGIFPGDFRYLPSGYAATPMGASFYVDLGCSSVCPMLKIGIRVQNSSSIITPSDCIQLIRRFAGLAKDNSDFLYIQRGTTSGPIMYFYPPIDPALVTCPTDTTYIQFWFKP